MCDQVEYHPYLDQTKVREACARHGMALVAYSPVAKGRIKNDRGAAADRRRATARRAAQVCLRWLVQQNVAAIPRTSRIERLSENIEIFDFELSEEEMEQIFALASAKGTAHGFRFRAEMGLRRRRQRLCWRLVWYRLGDDIEHRSAAMEMREDIPADITVSAVAHLSLLALVVISEVRPFGAVTAESRSRSKSSSPRRAREEARCLSRHRLPKPRRTSRSGQARASLTCDCRGSAPPPSRAA